MADKPFLVLADRSYVHRGTQLDTSRAARDMVVSPDQDLKPIWNSHHSRHWDDRRNNYQDAVPAVSAEAAGPRDA